jgi:hypothetical protein
VLAAKTGDSAKRTIARAASERILIADLFTNAVIIRS